MAELEVGGQFDADPADITTLVFSWVGHFDAGVLLANAGVITIENYSHPTHGHPLDMVLVGTPVLDAGSLSVTFQVSGGAEEHIYQISHDVTTAEVAQQHRRRSFFIQVRPL